MKKYINKHNVNNLGVDMKILVLIGIIILCITLVKADNYYSTNPNNCPASYQSQTCSGSNKVCGYSGGVTFCYDNSLLNPPASISTTTGTGGTDYSCSDVTCSGGFILDCYSYDSGSPFCDNNGAFLCDRNATCFNKHVQTNCINSAWISSNCSATCTTNYFACDSSTTDADGCEILAGSSCGGGTGTIVNNQCYSASAGNCTSATRLDCDNDDGDNNPTTCNGATTYCEILIGGSCTLAGLQGTYANYCTGTSGTCIVNKQQYYTGNKTSYSTNSTETMIGGVDYGVGTLINFTNNGTNSSFVVTNVSNVITSGNITGNYLFGWLNWSWIQNVAVSWSQLTNIPNIIYGIWGTNNANNLLISNGTAIGYNQTVFNASVSALINQTESLNVYNFINITAISNSTIVRSGNYNCPSGQVMQNVTVNSSGVFAICVASSMNYTNIGLTNQSNNWSQTQVFSGGFNATGDISLENSTLTRSGTNTHIGIGTNNTETIVVIKLG